MTKQEYKEAHQQKRIDNYAINNHFYSDLIDYITKNHDQVEICMYRNTMKVYAKIINNRHLPRLNHGEIMSFFGFDIDFREATIGGYEMSRFELIKVDFY